MCFESTDRTFRRVAAVYIRRYKLKRAQPFSADSGFVIGTRLVVEDVEVDGVPAISKALHDPIVGRDAVPVALGGKRF